MCGIAGFFRKDFAKADPAVLKKMTDAMILRGPDGEGFFCRDGFALGHRRLAVMDPEGGHQPIANEDGSVILVHNGEIYNFPELREELEKKGHIFRTRSDSECIVHLYEEEGEHFPERLLGMFAIALLDLRKKTLFLVTDRAGKKPIFYFETRSLFCFASSIKALAATGEMPDELNLQGIWDYFSLLAIPGPDTLYSKVRKLPPATLFLFSADREYPDVRQYWHPDYTVRETGSFEQCCRQLRERMFDSVRRRLVSDVPLGVFLSGGLDSAIVAALASEFPSAEPLHCFTIGFDAKSYDESALARKHAEFLSARGNRRLILHEKTVTPDSLSVLETLCAEYGEPFADASVIPTHLLCRFARESVTVALSGDGADELFGGYERYYALSLLAKTDRIPLPFRKMAAGLANSLFRHGGERSSGVRLRRLLNAACLSSAARYDSITCKFPQNRKYSVLGDAFGETPPEPTLRLAEELRKQTGSPDPAVQAMEMDFYRYLPDDILPKMDLASMSASLEVRSPFLDHRIIEFAAGLPADFKLHGRQRKYILSEAFRELLPPGIGTLRKRGFGVPVAAWFRGPWKEELTSRLLDGCAVNRYGLLRKEAVEEMIRRHIFGKEDLSYPLYTMFVLELTLGGF